MHLMGQPGLRLVGLQVAADRHFSDIQGGNCFVVGHTYYIQYILKHESVGLSFLDRLNRRVETHMVYSENQTDAGTFRVHNDCLVHVVLLDQPGNRHTSSGQLVRDRGLA